jgi:peptide deformylase
VTTESMALRSGDRLKTMQTIQLLEKEMHRTGYDCLAAIHIGVPVRIMVLRGEGALVNPVDSVVPDAEAETRLEATVFDHTTLVSKTRDTHVRVHYVDSVDWVVQTRVFESTAARCVLHLLEVFGTDF